MLAMLVVTTLTIPAWSSAGRRFGEMRALTVAVTSYIAISIMLGLLAYARAPWPVAVAAFGVLGAPFAAMQVLPYTIVAHLIHSESERGQAAEGSYTGVWTATEKLGLALGPALTGIVLWIAAGPALDALAALAIVGPALLATSALALLRNMPAAVPSARDLRVA